MAEGSKGYCAIRDCHLRWSEKQRRILSADGRAVEYYTSERGFSFTENELPHFFVMNDDTRRAFVEFPKPTTSPIVGAWKRTLFYGGFEHSTDQHETVYNVQTNTLFVDLRIPTTRKCLLNTSSIHSLEDMNARQLQYYARQHIFAGYTHQEKANNKFDLLCTRHHCIDWNFVGVPRNRPNKWYVEMNSKSDVWKEWAYAMDYHGQHYYCEHWERLRNGGVGPVVALCKAEGRHGILVIVGDHFNYCLDRENVVAGKDQSDSLVSLVDQALERNDLETARRWLSVQGGHGRIAKGWKIDKAIEFWKEGSPLWSKSEIVVEGDSIQDCRVKWNGETWNVFECSLLSVEGLQNLLWLDLES